jgi:hypothetical protein
MDIEMMGICWTERASRGRSISRARAIVGLDINVGEVTHDSAK